MPSTIGAWCHKVTMVQHYKHSIGGTTGVEILLSRLPLSIYRQKSNQNVHCVKHPHIILLQKMLVNKSKNWAYYSIKILLQTTHVFFPTYLHFKPHYLDIREKYHNFPLWLRKMNVYQCYQHTSTCNHFKVSRKTSQKVWGVCLSLLCPFQLAFLIR